MIESIRCGCAMQRNKESKILGKMVAIDFYNEQFMGP